MGVFPATTGAAYHGNAEKRAAWHLAPLSERSSPPFPQAERRAAEPGADEHDHVERVVRLPGYQHCPQRRPQQHGNNPGGEPTINAIVNCISVLHTFVAVFAAVRFLCVRSQFALLLA